MFNAKEYHRNYRKLNRAKMLEKSARWNLKRRKFLDGYKSERGCSDCPETDPIVLDFDHMDPKTKHKTLRLSGRSMSSLSWDDMMAELPKCEVRCANCHRRRTVKQREAKPKDKLL